MGKAKTKKQKNELIFDNQKREEFLKGFSKRKKQRKQKAQQEMEQKIKEERKRIQLESKNLKDKFKQSFKPIDELKDIISDYEDDEEIEGVSIKISGLNEDVSKKFIGLRKIESESEGETDHVSDKEEGRINGMDLMEKDPKKKEDSEDLAQLKGIKTEKDFKKMIKKQTKSAVKKSKVLQTKNNLNHKKNVKLSNRKKHFKEKFLKKHKKIPKHNKRK